jgi:Ser/Thr protein kinase RdoA (MazF antagonist)
MEESQMGHSVVMMNSNNVMRDLETRAIIHLDVHDYNIEVNNYTFHNIVMSCVCMIVHLAPTV